MPEPPTGRLRCACTGLFLCAIIHRPDGYRLWLAYADWLEERGVREFRRMRRRSVA